jgi:hypothetical protein
MVCSLLDLCLVFFLFRSKNILTSELIISVLEQSKRLPHTKMMVKFFTICAASLVAFAPVSLASLTEAERLAGYHARNYTWPPKFIPDSPGWSKLMMERLEQVAEIDDYDRKFEGYVQTLHHAALAPNFTELGFGLTRAPEPLMEELRSAIRNGLADGAVRSEGRNEVIDAPEAPLFIDRPDLMDKVLHDLQPYVEAWTGLELQPVTAYGLRLYQNESALWMHVDKMNTHVGKSSAIFHPSYNFLD